MTVWNIRACIVGGDPRTRAAIRSRLVPEADIQVVGECVLGAEATDEVRRLRPDLVLLDPGDRLAEAARAFADLGPLSPAALIVVGALDRATVLLCDRAGVPHAETSAPDERFRQALATARISLIHRNGRPAADPIRALVAELDRPEPHAARLVFRDGRRTLSLDVSDIDWIAAEGNYVRIHAGGRSHLVRETMKGIVSRLDPARHIRIHRSTIVNADRVAQMLPRMHGEYTIVLRDGTRFSSSRRQDASVQRLIACLS